MPTRPWPPRKWPGSGSTRTSRVDRSGAFCSPAAAGKAVEFWPLIDMARYEERDESYDLLNQYLQEISRIPRLMPERERELGHRVQQENDKAALEELVKSNLRFV